MESPKTAIYGRQTRLLHTSQPLSAAVANSGIQGKNTSRISLLKCEKQTNKLQEIEIGLEAGYDLKPMFLSGLKGPLPGTMDHMSVSSKMH